MAAAAMEPTKRFLRQTQLGDAVMNVPLAAVVIDPGTRTYLVVNDYMCELSGYQEDELVGMPVAQLADAAREEAGWERLAQGGVTSGTGSLLRKNGSTVAVQYFSSLTKVAGLDFVIGFFWDSQAA